MAHRGRLNVLAHNLGRPYETIFAEFEGTSTLEVVKAVTEIPQGGTGDVKYHHGAQRAYELRDGGDDPRQPGVQPVATSSSSTRSCSAPPAPPRPSARARRATRDPNAAVPIILHGDAAFPGQGVVAETLNLQALDGYTGRRHAAPRAEQPGRLHDRLRGLTLDALGVGPREGLRRSDHPRQRRRRRGLRHAPCGWRWRSAASSATTC